MGDAVVGDSTLAEPLHPGALRRPAWPPAPREEPRGFGELRPLNQEADQALPTPTAVVETSSPKKSQHQRRGCFASPPCFATAIHGALWSRPSLSLCVPQPLGVSDLLLAGPDGAYIARKSAS